MKSRPTQGHTALGFMPKSGNQLHSLVDEDGELKELQRSEPNLPVARTANEAEWKSMSLFR